MSVGGITIWEVLTGLMVPAIGGCFWLLKADIARVERSNEKARKEIWEAIDAMRMAGHAFQLEAAKRFAPAEDLRELKGDIDKRLDRIEAKLDKALGAGKGG